MARYVDGFLLTVPKQNLRAYRAMAQAGAKMGIPFTRTAKAKRGEVVVFSWIVYRSRAHRDKVNTAVMKDPRLMQMMQGKEMPFDMKRMSYGGFEVLVDA